MRFDDRLSTVLAQVGGDAHDRAVRWRQLVELLARSRGLPASPLVEQALAEVRSGAGDVDEQVRAATARAVSALPLPVSLVALFAADTVHVAAPMLGAASLDSEEWRQVYSKASPDNRRFLAALHPELEPAPAPAPAAPVPEPPRPAAVPPLESPIPSISEVVARIERLRQSREDLGGVSPPPPGDGDGSSKGLFRWECTPTGEIAWVDGAPRGALIGRSIAQPADDDYSDPAIARALTMRAPFRDASLVLAGEADWAGEWKISGIPAFEPSDGRFAGYRGIATRGEVRDRPAGLPAWADHDSLRELVHEIKTPLNAIIGFAEIIDSEYLGPADLRYRERAADIVAQARLLLSAIDDLDMAARLQSSRELRGEPFRLDELVERLIGELRERSSRQQVELAFERPGGSQDCAMASALAERLVRRFLETLIDSAGAGERIVVRIRSEGRNCLIVADLPHSLRSVADASDDAGDFRLRLLGGLARLAGGDAAARGSTLVLTLPRIG